MFDFIHKYRRVVQIFLALAMLPVAFVGIDAFQNSASADEAARVGKSKITLQQLEEAMRQRADQIRAKQGGAVDSKVFESPEFRQSVLNGLIQEKLVQQETARLGLVVSDAFLQDYIAQIPDFQENGKFSPAKYDSVLRNQGVRSGDFENNMRRNLNLQLLVSGVAGTSQASQTQLEQIIAAETQERQVAFALIPAQDYLKSITVSDDEMRQFYASNAPKFQLPERVKVAYVVLSDPKIAAKESENFDRMVYEQQSDSYKDVAQALNLKIENSDWISANGQGAQGILANPKILQTMFSAESLKDKRNSKAIEIAPNVFASVRVTEYQKASIQPFDSVSADIRTFLLRKAAVEKAAATGEAQLADLKAGKAVDLKWSPGKTVSLLQSGGLSVEAVQSIAAADVSQLPAYVGIRAGGDGYVLFKITAVKAGGALSNDTRAQITELYQRYAQQADIASLMVALRERHPVRIAVHPEADKQP